MHISECKDAGLSSLRFPSGLLSTWLGFSLCLHTVLRLPYSGRAVKFPEAEHIFDYEKSDQTVKNTENHLRKLSNIIQDPGTV